MLHYHTLCVLYFKINYRLRVEDLFIIHKPKRIKSSGN